VSRRARPRPAAAGCRSPSKCGGPVRGALLTGTLPAPRRPR
jgi:hypothetical protein